MEKIDDLEQMFGLQKKPKKKKPTDKPQLVDKLLQKPNKDKGKNMPHYQPVPEPNITQQADLLFLPDDGGNRYALVVKDTGAHKLVDAEPLKDKSQESVLKAFKKIYSRKILKVPQILQVDPGAEFGGVVNNWFTFDQDKPVWVRVGKPGRHRQQAMVERANQTIAKALFRRMSAEELLTGATSKAWVQDLPKLVKVLNHQNTKKPLPEIKKFPAPVCSGDSCKMLAVGTKVRVILEQPKDPITGKTLHGKFRSTDNRWESQTKTIKRVIINMGLPPLYKVGDDGPSYTKNQLQVVSDNEQMPNRNVIRGKPDTYVVRAIVGKRWINRKIEYKVVWQGYDDSEYTWEPRAKLAADVPDEVRQYELKTKGKFSE